MKAGFKPKTFSRKEWEDNRSPVAKGSGVGKALDAWKTKCPFDMSEITAKEIEDASKAASALDTALDVAKKKCNSKAQKETIDGIDEYKKIVADYEKLLKENLEIIKKRNAFELSLPVVLADKELSAAFINYTKKVADNYPILHTYLLAKSDKHEEAVKLYGKGNEYNMYDPSRKILLQAYLSDDKIKTAVNPEHLKAAKAYMLSDTRKTITGALGKTEFGGNPEFLKIISKKIPSKNFSI